MEKVKFSRPASELGCILGHLFLGMEPPCDATHVDGDWLTFKLSSETTVCHYHLGTGDCASKLIFKGHTKGGGYAEVEIEKDRCEFYGDPAELQAVLDGKCPDRRCGHA